MLEALLLDVEEADEASKQQLASEQTQQEAAYLQSVFARIVVASASHSVTPPANAVADPNADQVHEEVKHRENGCARVERKIRDLQDRC